ncbi:MAG: UDP-N-acetylmuramate dehydrogenase [Clostridia bacterium]|nr:UDP-N-acetylmuramate dehydrogenase [Clostridia bacterium]
MSELLINELKNKYACQIKENEPLKAYTSFKIGGCAKYVVFPQEKDSLAGIVRELKEQGVKYTVIGNGSNLLVPDDGYDGVAIITTGIKNISCEGEILHAGCGASLIKLSVSALENSLTGLEFAYGIPGSVGGAVYMNAGAYVSEISEILHKCVCYDTLADEMLTLDNKACDFSYRNSIFEQNESRYVILEASFLLKRGNKDDIRAMMDDFMSRRREKQPLEYPSAGSAFKRAPGYFTAKLIDDAGLKGYSIGGAQVSEKHAGFIINTGSASASDVLSLMEHIKTTVKERFGVDIEGEIRILE